MLGIYQERTTQLGLMAILFPHILRVPSLNSVLYTGKGLGAQPILDTRRAIEMLIQQTALVTKHGALEVKLLTKFGSNF